MRFTLIDRQAGGKNGRAVLADEARKFLYTYEQWEGGLKEIVDEKFRSMFAGGSHV